MSALLIIQRHLTKNLLVALVLGTLTVILLPTVMWIIWLSAFTSGFPGFLIYMGFDTKPSWSISCVITATAFLIYPCVYACSSHYKKTNSGVKL